MNNIEVKLFLDGEDGDEFPLGVVPAPVIRRHPIASPHCIPLFSRPIVALPSPSDGGVGQGRSRDARAAGRTDEGRRRRGEDSRSRLTQLTTTKARTRTRQLNDDRTHARTLRDRVQTESWPTSFLDVAEERSAAVNRKGDLGFFVRRPKKGSGYFMLYPPSSPPPPIPVLLV